MAGKDRIFHPAAGLFHRIWLADGQSIAVGFRTDHNGSHLYYKPDPIVELDYLFYLFCNDPFDLIPDNRDSSLFYS